MALLFGLHPGAPLRRHRKALSKPPEGSGGRVSRARSSAARTPERVHFVHPPDQIRPSTPESRPLRLCRNGLLRVDLLVFARLLGVMAPLPRVDHLSRARGEPQTLQAHRAAHHVPYQRLEPTPVSRMDKEFAGSHFVAGTGRRGGPAAPGLKSPRGRPLLTTTWTPATIP